MNQNNPALLSRLKEHNVQFVVVGGFCAIYHGVPLITYDLDVCCPFDAENVKNIGAALRGLNAFHRLAANKLPLEIAPVTPDFKNLYVQTEWGKLDFLGEIVGVGDYNEVLKHSIAGKLNFGEFRFLDIDGLIAAKRAVGRSHDMRTVGFLEAIKEKGR